MGVSTMNKGNINDSKGNNGSRRRWKQKELWFLITYLVVFYVIIIHQSLQISHDHYNGLHGLRPGWLLPLHLNDDSDAQWRNFQGNIPILTLVFVIFTLLANTFSVIFKLKARGMSIVWLLFSFIYLSYLHGACIIFVLSIATVNFLLVQETMGIFGWLSGYLQKHHQRCQICKSGKSCYQILQERSVQDDKFAYSIYLCYLAYAPLYIASPILSFNAFASQWFVEAIISYGSVHHWVWGISSSTSILQSNSTFSLNNRNSSSIVSCLLMKLCKAIQATIMQAS